MSETDPRSLLELLAALARDIPDLVHKEVVLARVEARRALDLLLVARVHGHAPADVVTVFALE